MGYAGEPKLLYQPDVQFSHEKKNEEVIGNIS
jgi:hypothetical protein